jgi:hypothetical protein
MPECLLTPIPDEPYQYTANEFITTYSNIFNWVAAGDEPFFATRCQDGTLFDTTSSQYVWYVHLRDYEGECSLTCSVAPRDFRFVEWTSYTSLWEDHRP